MTWTSQIRGGPVRRAAVARARGLPTPQQIRRDEAARQQRQEEGERQDRQAEVALFRAVMENTIQWNCELPKVAGILQKMHWQGPCGLFGRSWHPRWVELDPSEASLSYWEPRRRDRKPKRCCKLMELQQVDFNSYHLVMFLSFPDGVLQFRANSTQDYAQWLSILGAYCPHIWHYLGDIPRQLQELLPFAESDRALTLSDICILEQDVQSAASKVGVGVYKWNDHTSSTQEYAQHLCVVCLFDFEEGEKISELQCGHAFHASCISKWLFRFNSCPICKAVVKASRPQGMTI